MAIQPDGYRLGFSRLRDFNSNVFNTLKTIRLVFALCEIFINEDPVVPEWKLVMDMTGFSVGHLIKVTNLTIIKKCLCYIQVNMTIKLIKSIVYTNLSDSLDNFKLLFS